MLTGVAAALLVLGAASLFLGDRPARGPGRVDHVAFGGAARAEGIPERIDDSTRDAAAQDIRDVLDAWYQQAFADPAGYGDGSFPSIASRFVGDAAIGFVEDKDALTIGALASQVASVRVDSALANITIYAEDDVISWATAAVEFDALAHLEDRTTEVLISQRVTLVLEQRLDVGWVITNYYDAFQRQRSRPRGAQPRPTETSS